MTETRSAAVIEVAGLKKHFPIRQGLLQRAALPFMPSTA
jgi:hypothetical protein